RPTGGRCAHLGVCRCPAGGLLRNSFRPESDAGGRRLMLTVFGIRHHGPGCARSLVAALHALQPDVVLVEGPPDAQDQIALAADPGMQPPVALVVYPVDAPQQASFFPFAEFSPEWQALRWCLEHEVPVRFADLPCAVRFAKVEIGRASCRERVGFWVGAV